MPGRPSPTLSRRQLLVGAGAAAGAVLLGSCGEDGEASGEGDASSASDLALAQLFGGPMFVAGTEARAPFGVADADGLLPIDQTPESLTVTILDPAGAPVGKPLAVSRRAQGIPRGYFPLRFTVEQAGIYTARTTIDGVAAEMAVKVDDAGDVTVIQPGTRLPDVATPTFDDGAGVDPICTAEPPCPLHDVTLSEALGEGRSIALLVATPAFCQVSICGPVLDVLLGVTESHPDVRFLHAEVYAHPDEDLDTHAPIVGELGLHFEPCLLLAGADGVVRERLDTIYDETELLEALERLG